jgi:hypothetical protein
MTLATHPFSGQAAPALASLTRSAIRAHGVDAPRQWARSLADQLAAIHPDAFAEAGESDLVADLLEALVADVGVDLARAEPDHIEEALVGGMAVPAEALGFDTDEILDLVERAGQALAAAGVAAAPDWREALDHAEFRTLLDAALAAAGRNRQRAAATPVDDQSPGAQAQRAREYADFLEATGLFGRSTPAPRPAAASAKPGREPLSAREIAARKASRERERAARKKNRR